MRYLDDKGDYVALVNRMKKKRVCRREEKEDDLVCTANVDVMKIMVRVKDDLYRKGFRLPNWALVTYLGFL